MTSKRASQKEDLTYRKGDGEVASPTLHHVPSENAEGGYRLER
jgi:hypothetical protein